MKYQNSTTWHDNGLKGWVEFQFLLPIFISEVLMNL